MFGDEEDGGAVGEAAAEDVDGAAGRDAEPLLELGAAERQVAGGDVGARVALLQRLERRRPERQHLDDAPGLKKAVAGNILG